MNAVTYQNTKTNIPGWVDDLHTKHGRGYAYETSTHFIHFYGRDFGFFAISTGLTAVQKKQGTLSDWVTDVLGATNIQQMVLPVGTITKGVWRPYLYYYEDTENAFGTTEQERRNGEQALRILIEKLDELFLFIEPDVKSFDTYSHKCRELLILACTEVENQWKWYLNLSGSVPVNGTNYTTNDYVKLVDKLFLREFEFELRAYNTLPTFNPYLLWNSRRPSQSLDWYEAYNKTKHDRALYFSEAKLIHCINAVVANLVLYCVKYSPFPMLEENNTFSAVVNSHFVSRFVNCSPDTFYLPEVVMPTNARDDLFVYDSRRNKNIAPSNLVNLIL